MLIHMIRKQVYIDEEQERGLKRMSALSGEPEAVHVRAALRAFLDANLPSSADDPLERIVGLVPDVEGPDDVAANHDRYLYST